MKKIFILFMFIVMIGSVSAIGFYKDLNMFGYQILNASNITATKYFGDGSSLTGINASSDNSSDFTLGTGIIQIKSGNGTDFMNYFEGSTCYNGCTLYLPSGDYNINHTLKCNVSSNSKSIKVIGNGIGNTWIYADTNFSGQYMFNITSCDSFQIQDVSIKSSRYLYPVIINNSILSTSNLGRYQKVAFVDFRGDALTIKGVGTAGYYNTIQDVNMYFTNYSLLNGSRGIVFTTYANQNEIIGGVLCGDTQVHISNSDHITLIGSSLECDQTRGSSKKGIYIEGVGSVDETFINPRFESTNQTYSIYINDTVVGDVQLYGGSSTLAWSTEPLVYYPSNYTKFSQWGQFVSNRQMQSNNRGSALFQYQATPDSIYGTTIWLDKGFQGNDLTKSGTATFVNNGRDIGAGAWDMNGTGYFTKTSSSGIRSPYVTGLTVRLIYRYYGNATKIPLVAAINDSGNFSFIMDIQTNTSQAAYGQLHFQVYNPRNSSQMLQRSMGGTANSGLGQYALMPLQVANTWYEVVATYDIATGTMCEYLNGKMDYYCFTGTVDLGNYTGRFSINYDPYIIGTTGNASYQLVEVYPFAVSSDHVRRWYEQRITDQGEMDLNRAYGGTIYGNMTSSGTNSFTGTNNFSGTTSIVKPSIPNITMNNGTTSFCLKVNSSGLLQLASGVC